MRHMSMKLVHLRDVTPIKEGSGYGVPYIFGFGKSDKITNLGYI